MTKQEIRKELRRRAKEELNAEHVQWASQVVVDLIETLPEFSEERRVGLYHALPDEPNLASLLDRYSSRMALYLPRVEGDDIAYYRYRGPEDLRIGAFGIEEPKADPSEALPPEKLDLILVPATAFDDNGFRLGRGKGFYDRFLPKAPNACRVGVTYALMDTPQLPTDPWDTAMDVVVSPHGVRRCK
ncbi:hypothetical protein HQ45_06725 [Porphyromonas crevioricanis]|uniref:5-formyltetrahydrofolate cyclo-ligase n=2 Tax=Porphyromonas crevioricanis TaxID=393921 RepID=A0A0A2FUL0_9PORP|nr:5-formyltetrahydrofolate cyclo-ligase [Porphyromonas crevioricanis]KGN89680.1 hypothetical protein HQ45_06725 [Porphyromonas crevioricanis]KGN93765.1 hypothetical protein HQ38_08290 [Porphyromonas crevioricanis]SJZ78151.1 5-formyltetrahydrofolate cyclo-ligase [Porphyromonas crevioricanis]SQH72382.1 5-formyltetrahydrofolate cyclo-ligase family protein [Porphyromonas crevioricanis]GAD04530.1 5-formyltetrahydrofolate cyclo-ligase [Porphyromonas crevioricanis JCM 15906]